MMRGTLCSICIDPADIDTLYSGSEETNDLKLKITPDSMTSYISDVEGVFTC